MASVQLPKKYKAAVYDKPGSISTKIEELDMPEPGPGEVLVNLTHSGVCHSDMGIMTQSWKHLPFPTQAGQVGGHEGVGKIVKMGPATDASSVKVGDRVGIKWMSGVCDTCDACRAGLDASCKKGKVSGYYTPGTFQQYALAPANYVTPIPDGLDSAAAAPMLCAGVTVYSALRKSNTQSGNFVVLLGAGGGLGHLGTQFAAHGMALRVIGVDHSSKKDLVLSSGAEHFIPIDTTDDLAGAVKNLTDGLGAHAVVVLTSNNKAYASAFGVLRHGGTIVCIGVPEGDPVPVAVTAGQLITNAVTVKGVAVGTRRDAIETLEFAARGVVKSHYRVEKLEKLTEVFREMDGQKMMGRVVIDLS